MRHQLEPDPSFDYRTATEAEILARALLLEGHMMGDIVGASFSASEARRGKGEVGAAIEHFFGIPPNARQEADFPGAGIELKVVPLLRTGRGFRIKERTVISMIDYDALMFETWSSATVRKKLHIMFVFFEHLLEQPKSTFPILKGVLWKPDEATESFIQADWERVFLKVRQGVAHLLSESDGRILGPSTKGPGGSRPRSQPFNRSQPAKSRAFALKPAFMLDLYERVALGRQEESLVANQVTSPTAEFEAKLVQRFSRFEARTVEEVGSELGVPASKAKSYAAQVMRRAFGAKDFRSPIREFEAMGLTPRITRVDPKLMPFESLSFPAFRYLELLQETWEDSDLLSRIEFMLFVPVHGATKNTPQGECTFGRPVFWRPSSADLEVIRQEWELFRLEIRTGQAKELTPASKTSAIHVRPHARNASDVDIAPLVGPTIKKSFWMNRSYVAKILSSI